MKICHFVSGLSCAGGAERVMCEFANEMSARGHSMTIIGHREDVTKPFFPLNRSVHIYNIGCVSDEECVPRLFNMLTALKPDVVLSDHLYNHDIVVKAVKHTYPLILRHHFDHGHLMSNETDNKFSLLFCDCIQLLLPNFETRVNEWLPFVKTKVIPNPVNIDVKSVNLSVEKSEYIISMIGRLDSNQKQQHVLIDAFAKLAPCYPHWKLCLYGGNPNPDHYARDLQIKIENLKLTHQIQLMGATEDSIAALHQSDIFAFPTRFEGWGLALTEAMSVGLPCVGLKSTSAVNQIIINGYNGFLAKDAGFDLAYKLRVLMDDPQLRQTLGYNARESVKAYAHRIVYDKWEELLTEVTVDFKKKDKVITAEERVETINTILTEEQSIPECVRIVVCQFMYGDKPYFELSEKINRAYCQKHGYEYHIFHDAEIRKEARINEITNHKGDNQMLFTDMCFSKIKSVARFMETSNCDYVLFLDADAIFYSHDLLIEEEIVFGLKDKTFLVALDVIDIKDEGRYKYFQNRYEHQNANSGVFLVKNNCIGKEIMRYWAFETYDKYKNTLDDWFLHDQWALNEDVIPKYREHVWIESSWYFLNGKGQYIRHYMNYRSDIELQIVCDRMRQVWNRVKPVIE